MKKIFQSVAFTAILANGLVCGQTTPSSAPPPIPTRQLAQPALPPRSPATIPPPAPAAVSAPGQEEPTKFNLDFPGGTPKELVAAIQKAMERPLNAIVPEEFADVRLPALKMDNVNVAQLFEALASASRKSEAVVTGNVFGQGYQNYSTVETGYGFRQGSQGRITDNTIWYFYVQKPVLPPYSSQSKKACRFYSLAGYLDQRLTVDDITTAIETGWKMLGESPTPTISYHKDTKLLIAVGEPNKLETIDLVLRALSETPKPQPAPAPAPPKPAEKPKKGE